MSYFGKQLLFVTSLSVSISHLLADVVTWTDNCMCLDHWKQPMVNWLLPQVYITRLQPAIPINIQNKLWTKIYEYVLIFLEFLPRDFHIWHSYSLVFAIIQTCHLISFFCIVKLTNFDPSLSFRYNMLMTCMPFADAEQILAGLRWFLFFWLSYMWSLLSFATGSHFQLVSGNNYMCSSSPYSAVSRLYVLSNASTMFLIWPWLCNGLCCASHLNISATDWTLLFCTCNF